MGAQHLPGHRRAEDAARPLLTVHFLGRFHVTLAGAPVDTTSSRRTRNVLAYLLAKRDAPVPRDVLMEVFWPGADPDAARNRLHVALSGVRQVLRDAWPRPVIERRVDAYRISDSVAVWSDVEQFEASHLAGSRAEAAGDRETAERCYQAACQLYEGDFLSDDPYVDWALTARETLQLHAVEILRRLMQIYIDRHHHGPAAVLGRRILEMDPCNEQVHRLLMTCYAATNQRHLALAQYARLTAALWEAFRVRPSAETVGVYESLRRPVAVPSGTRSPVPSAMPRPA
jgi:DNA-binding SARP family transcriptional activator